MTSLRLLLSLILILASVSVAQARTVWVDDKLYLPVRSGAGTQFRIIENAVPSGTPLEVLEVGDGYTKVRTPKGTEGWVSSQYLSNQPIAADRLRRATQQLEQTRSELTSVREQLSAVTEERDNLQNAENSLSNRAGELQEELTRIKNIAADSINLERRNRELREENQKLRNDLEVLTAENERLEASKDSDFMLLGAGLVLGGVLLALLIPMLKPTRKTDNWA
ncbi:MULTISPECIES: TIGR04211 family SH3 domain-containing protein [unclassified Marinobacter]|uniref:TIGR04211 family SH3 domain-containing protein n=1 Tax=unclassified Marinobacter TaxID=83889 RepID=UPI000718B44C|nr:MULTISPECIES: TIGR04211 family SH3 domain-containing protein [unclassified Marinobacter]MDX5441011.1 TIGR04211 family SH3 domain-containing protein [Alteromonadaceae bacterium]AMQ90695.1 peptide-binding protein [Marinobacter sp. LQ44]MDX5336063.1 TIGR04211 family SH3 domain-containing protein [Marinobacter sp.]MDX5387110.1 TIGR04211 family SH3 domain-containing protein [Marinobacter sp.]MDX5472481.1 TIGR04211 family SH3 domain-containing protein [Marinobacter sp.]